jgi:hypothetical protein
MQWDFWNNPLVVSAFRTKGKKQFPLAAFIVSLVAVGAVMEYFARTAVRPWQTPWHHNYLVVVVAIAAGASFLFAMIATQTSIAAEVSNKTLDFQRITGLSPAEVVVGKIFGEPALAYLLIPASFPIALFCVLRSDSIGIGAIFVVYLNLAAFAILGGALGLLHPLEQAAGKTGGGGAAAAWAIVFMVGIPYIIGSGMLIARSPTAAFVLGTFTPASVISGLYAGDVWQHKLNLFGWTLPYAVFSPIAHLSLAFLLFSVMARRLKNPVETPLSKPLAYFALAIIDLLLVGYLIGEDPLKGKGGAGYNLAAFAIAHAVLSMALAFCVTPNREGVDSWIWGLRRGKRDWQEWLVGDRSPNSVAVVVMATIGLLAALLLLGLSGGVMQGLADFNVLGPQSSPFNNAVGLAIALAFFASFGWLVQAASLTMKRMTAAIIVGTIYLLYSMSLAVAGNNLDVRWAASLSPFAHFIAWTDPREFHRLVISPAPCLAALTVASALGLALTLRYKWGFRRIVEGKLRAMGVASP